MKAPRILLVLLMIGLFIILFSTTQAQSYYRPRYKQAPTVNGTVIPSQWRVWNKKAIRFKGYKGKSGSLTIFTRPKYKI